MGLLEDTAVDGRQPCVPSARQGQDSSTGRISTTGWARVSTCRGLDQGVVVVAGDDVEAGQLLDGLGVGPVGDEDVRSRTAPERPRPAAVVETGTARHRPASRPEPFGELAVGVEGGLVVGVGTGQPRCLVIGGEQDDVLAHGLPLGWCPPPVTGERARDRQAGRNPVRQSRFEVTSVVPRSGSTTVRPVSVKPTLASTPARGGVPVPHRRPQALRGRTTSPSPGPPATPRSRTPAPRSGAAARRPAPVRRPHLVRCRPARSSR